MTEQKPKLRLRVPKGFYNLMEVFVRDILKNKPLDVFDHGTKFFETLLQVRTITGHDPSVHGATSLSGMTCDQSAKVNNI